MRLSYLADILMAFIVLGLTLGATSANAAVEVTPIVKISSGQAVTLNEGERQTYILNGNEYDTTADFVGESITKFTINGKLTDSLAEGETRKIGEGVEVKVTNIFVQSFAGGIRRVTFVFISEAETEPICNDSDGGFEPYETGDVYVNGKYDSTDYCINNSELVEKNCYEGKVKSERFVCLNGCKDGACANEGKDFIVSDQKVALNEGEMKIYVLNNREYRTTADFVGSNEVKFTVNGETTNSITKGVTYTLENGPTIGINDIVAQSFAGGVRRVQFHFTEIGREEPDLPVTPIEPPEFPYEKIASIQLSKGWNLISLPGELEKFLQSNCSANKKLIGFVYLAEQEKYATLQEAQRILGDGFGKYLATHSFLVYSYSECTMKAAVKETRQVTSLLEGWNLVPVTKNFIGQTFSSIISNCVIESAYNWNADDQNWEEIGQDEMNLMFREEQLNSGMLIKSSNSCTLV